MSTRPDGVRAGRLDDDADEAAADEGRAESEDRQPGVGLDERHPRRDEAGRGRAADHAVGLGEHQRAEGTRVEHEQVARVQRHDQRQHAAAERAAGHRPAPAVLEAVERRADHRCDDRERRHRDQQVEQDVPALGVRRRAEEDGAGQRDRDHRVRAVAQHLVPDERGQPGLAGAVGLAGRADPLGDVPRALHTAAGDAARQSRGRGRGSLAGAGLTGAGPPARVAPARVSPAPATWW